jgi:hypothetical protein
MKFTRFAILLAAASTVLYSCSKDDTKPEDGGNSDALKGTYDFVGMTVASTSTLTSNDGYSSDSMAVISYYNSKNNEGTVVVDGSSFNITGFAYRVDTMVRIVSYRDGELESDATGPFISSTPKVDSRAPYKLIGTDSIYYEKGFITSPGGSTGVDSAPGGYRFSWSGDTLILRGTAETSERETDPGSGTVSVSTIKASQIVKLKKRK